MNQPNYDFAYNSGGIVNYIWKNAGDQSSSTSNNSFNSGNTITSGQYPKDGSHQGLNGKPKCDKGDNNHNGTKPNK